MGPHALERIAVISPACSRVGNGETATALEPGRATLLERGSPEGWVQWWQLGRQMRPHRGEKGRGRWSDRELSQRHRDRRRVMPGAQSIGRAGGSARES
jgi:hypothetical protein